MPIYFNTNLQEARGLLAFNRISNKISDTLHRLETGFRINSAKDDPTGLVTREIMRSDIQATKSALRNTAQANTLFDVADKAMSSIASQLNGDPDSSNLGLIGILSDTTITAAQKREQVLSVLDTIDKLATSTIYNNKQIIGGALDYKSSNLTGSGTATLSDVRVTRAEDIDGATPQIVKFKLNSVAQKAGIYLGAETSSLEADDVITLTIADAKGNTYTENLTVGATGDKLLVDILTPAKVAELNGALESQGVDVRIKIANSDKAYDTAETTITNGTLIFESLEKGKNQSLSLSFAYTPVATGTFGGVVLNDRNTAAATTVPVTGRNWGIAGEGNVWTDGDYIKVSSNAAAFSAKLTGAKIGDELSFEVRGGTSFQLGKDVISKHRLYTGIQDMRTINLGGQTGKLEELRTLNFDDDADLKKALSIAQEAIQDVAMARGRIGTAQNMMSVNRENIEDQLVLITDAEAQISNTDVAEEASRLARYELIAQSAVSSIQYSRSFASFAVSSLLSGGSF